MSGLLDGILGATAERLRAAGARQIEAWIGPAICGACYEVCPVKIDIPTVLVDLLLRAGRDGDRFGLRRGGLSLLVRDDWSGETVPLASLVRGHGQTPTRLVLFRRPIEHRCESRADLEAMVLTVVVEQVAELLGIEPEDVDPRYTRGD